MLHLKTITIAVITAVSILMPISAYPLGIGAIKLQSKLNETLKAEIELLESANENVSNIYVNLAPREKFTQADIPWTNFLTTMKLKLVKKANGNIFIEVSSKAVLKEVFLSFIVEVNENKSLLYREFTVLIDPPVDYNPSFISATPKTKPFVSDNLPFFAPETSEKTNKHITQYGPIKSTDYIRKIAKKTRYDDISIEQMTLALFNANPEAFFTDNINALITKKMLIIPEKEKILEISRKDALEQVNLHNNIWKERLASKTQTPQTPQAAIDIANDHSQISLKDAETKITKSVNNFTVNNNAKQLAGISSTEISAIFAKLDKLEQKMELMQNNLVSKDKLTILPPSVNESESTTNAKTDSAEGLVLLAKQKELEQKIETMEKTIASQEQLIATLREQNKAIITSNVKPIVQATIPIKEASKKDSSTKRVTITRSSSFSSSVIQWFETNFMLLLQIGIAVGILLALFAYVWWLNEKKKKKAEEDALIEYLKPLDLAKSSFKNLDVSLNDFLTDDHLYEVAVEHKETDICTEVDVYLSYSNYKNAESLIRQAIEHYPENNEYKLKLLEVFLVSKNKTDFESFKTQLENIIDHGNQEFWADVAKMEDKLISASLLHEIMSGAGDNSVKNMDVNMTVNELIVDDVQTTTDDEITFDIYDFDDVEVSSIAKATIASIDKVQAITDDEITFDVYNFNDTEISPIKETSIESSDNTQEIDDDEIIRDMYSFYNTEINPITEENIESIDNTEAIVDDEISLDMYDFYATEINPISEASIESSDNAEAIIDDEITFDMYDFYDTEINPIAETSVESSDNIEAIVDDEISLDMYDFYDTAINPIAEENIESGDNIKGGKSKLTSEKFL